MNTNKELRILVTNACNYNCTFCHGEGEKVSGEKTRTLNALDYQFLFKVISEKFGIQEVTITGGEPCMRPDLIEIVKALHECGAYITLVTNASKLSIPIGKGIAQYIDKFNISLHSVLPEVYNKITGSGKLKNVIANIESLIGKGAKIHLNYVLCEHNSDWNNIESVIKFAQIGAVTKFIELFGTNFAHDQSIKIEDYNDTKLVKKMLEDHGFIQINENIRSKTFQLNSEIVRIDKLSCAVVKDTGDKNLCKKLNSPSISAQGDLKICFSGGLKIGIFDLIKNRDKSGIVEAFQKWYDLLGNNCPLIADIEDLF